MIDEATIELLKNSKDVHPHAVLGYFRDNLSKH